MNSNTMVAAPFIVEGVLATCPEMPSGCLNRPLNKGVTNVSMLRQVGRGGAGDLDETTAIRNDSGIEGRNFLCFN